jgi:hypothetical protein
VYEVSSRVLIIKFSLRLVGLFTELTRSERKREGSKFSVTYGAFDRVKIIGALQCVISREKLLGRLMGLDTMKIPFCLITWKIVRVEEKFTGRKMYFFICPDCLQGRGDVSVS